MMILILVLILTIIYVRIYVKHQFNLTDKYAELLAIVFKLGHENPNVNYGMLYAFIWAAKPNYFRLLATTLIPFNAESVSY